MSLFNISVCLLGAAAISSIWFQTLDPRGIYIFIGFLAISELFLRLRWRIAMTCRHCGFDPVLYLKDVNLAVEKVQRRLNARKLDPNFMLAAPLKLPIRRMPKKGPESVKEEALRLALQRRSGPRTSDVTLPSISKGSTRGQIVSKQI